MLGWSSNIWIATVARTNDSQTHPTNKTVLMAVGLLHGELGMSGATPGCRIRLCALLDVNEWDSNTQAR